MKLFLIRHGETTGDIEDRYGGWYDDHLTERGRAQLTETAEKLKHEKIDIICTSPLIRAQESATIINDSINVPVEIVEGLKERNYGILGGLTKTEALDKYPEVVASHKDPSNTDPGGETQTDFINRVRRAFTRIHSCEENNVIIVAHGGPLKVMLESLNATIPKQISDGEIITLTT